MMTDETMALRQMPEARSEATFRRGMTGFAARRLMELALGEATGAPIASAAPATGWRRFHKSGNGAFPVHERFFTRMADTSRL